MATVVPHSFLFRYSIPAGYRKSMPKRRGRRPLQLPAKFKVPNLRAVDDVSEFAELRVAWNDFGIGFTVLVRKKKNPPTCDDRRVADSDGLQVWIDTRNTKNVHRATRFCHHFCALPAGNPTGPIGIQLPIGRAREEAKIAASDDILVAVQHRTNGYDLDLWLPADVLNGFDPESVTKLGFYYLIRDSELGNQFLLADDDFPFASDPSLWATLELIR